MADKKITELTNITGANLVDADEFVVVDISADETKAITLGELKEAFDAGSGFVRITGDTMTGDLSFGDNDKAIFGAGSDLQIYHDGSNSFIKDLGTGDLLIQASNIQLEDPDGNNYLRGVDGGILQLYHSGGEVMRTASTGVDVTGTVVASDSVQIDSGGTGFLVGGGQTGTTAIGKLHNSSGLLTLDTDGTRSIKLATGTTQRLRIDGSGGDISFYEDTGTTPKMVWKSADERLGIGTSLPSRTLSVNGVAGFGNGTIETIISFSDRGIFGTQSNHALEIRTNGEEAVRIDTSGDLTVKGGRIFVNESDNGNTAIGLTRDADEGYVQVYSAGAITSQIRGNGDSYFNGGNVGIGTSLPSYRLDLGTVSNGTTLFNVTNGSNSNLRFKVEDGVSTIMNTGGSGELAFTSGGTTERMRIDSSGNLLVGTTVSALHSSPTESGARLYDGGIVTAGAGTVAYFNRNGAGGDGTIIDLRKDGAPVGSIGTLADDLSIGNLDTGLIFQGAGDRISPFNPATNSYRDAAIDLGKDDRRFKDLYLSGTVNTDSVSTASADLTAIAKDISDTAVDLFVYDTSKDSDGGAWRKRTQGTSWYNETLNTATRGSRKEFPAVAVIVAESNQVTIYDGDDPDLPMWMVFNGSNSQNMIQSSTQSSASALNSEISLGSSGNLHRINFAADIGYADTHVGRFPYLGNVSDRNGSNGFGTADAAKAIVNATVNDVAMTVLPNAPIDAATGLPVPTIAVATDGGVSVITDSGAVYDSDYTDSIRHVAFDGANTLFYTRNASAYLLLMAEPSEYTSGDGFGTGIASTQVGTQEFNLISSRSQTTTAFSDGVVASGGVSSTSGPRLLGLYDIDKSNLTNTMAAGIHYDYNTGWMNGDIKGAFLSDTDDTDLVGSGELVTNGTFDTDISGWNDFSTGTGSLSWNASGYLDLVSASADDRARASQAITTVVGKTYVIEFDHLSGTAILIRVGTSEGGTQNVNTSVDTGSYSITFVATASTSYVSLYGPAALGTISVDNISVKLADADRSVNNNGLIVNGTVTKNPVATGADLVAYSGFSASNYLEQPYNSALDFGTGDFCVMGWFKLPAGANQYQIIDRKAASGPAWQVKVENTAQKLYFSITDDFYTTRDEVLSSSAVDTDAWTFGCCVRSGSTLYVYVNGALAGSTAITNATGSLSNTSATMLVGIVSGGSIPFAGSLALWRISATAPTAEQIAKIYEDEKVLFQENAQATLYGSSDAVTALAYDDTTNILSVGTSAGRSDFQGLRRVNNTTNAVGAAISASNGLIVEE